MRLFLIAAGIALLGIASPDIWASEPLWWSFRKAERPLAPAVKEAGWIQNPIDAFILAKLEEKGLRHAPLADRRTLIRRAYFDLIGLPPSPEKVDQFLKDPSPKAYPNLIEQLLASKQYGERWARHWLDVARYADTGGYETDIYFKNAWRYRDYVVKSFNDDKPYDRFAQEQLAGDELWPDNLDLDGSFQVPPEKRRHLEARIGTGLFALGTQIHESNMEPRKAAYERLTDWVDTTGSAFLGLTIACARCHDHKFDPLTQLDYYGLQAVFAGSKEMEIPVVTAMEIADHKQHYPRLLAVDEARRACRVFDKSVAGRPLTSAEQQKRQRLRESLAAAVLDLPEQATSAPNDAWDGLMEIPSATVLGHEQPELVSEVYRLRRGDLRRPKEKVQPALPAILARQTGQDPALPGPFGSRKALALWLTRLDNPLTARVMVNRLWAWHFGRGIVATANDFGKMGALPTHPELLDWLATEFVTRGWSIKEMHRLIMLSSTYQESSLYLTPEHSRIDPDNKYLWRMNRRRLEAESLWDAVHAVADTLNPKMGGRPVMPPLAPEELTNKAEWVTCADPQEHTRRGLYILARRNFRFPMFDIFDAPVNAVSCAGRDVSTVAPQALWLMNNRTAFGQSQNLAARLVRETASSPLAPAGEGAVKERTAASSGPLPSGGEGIVRGQTAAWVDRAWRLALGRAPTKQEAAEAQRLIDNLERNADPSDPLKEAPAELASLPPARAAALTKFCLALFNLNEFIYID